MTDVDQQEPGRIFLEIMIFQIRSKKCINPLFERFRYKKSSGSAADSNLEDLTFINPGIPDINISKNPFNLLKKSGGIKGIREVPDDT